MRQQAANSNIVPFPAARLMRLDPESDDISLEQDGRIPFGVCLVIWAALAVIGWGALDAAARLI